MKIIFLIGSPFKRESTNLIVKNLKKGCSLKTLLVSKLIYYGRIIFFGAGGGGRSADSWASLVVPLSRRGGRTQIYNLSTTFHFYFLFLISKIIRTVI